MFSITHNGMASISIERNFDEVFDKNLKSATLQKKNLKHNVEAWLFKNVNADAIKSTHENM